VNAGAGGTIDKGATRAGAAVGRVIPGSPCGETRVTTAPGRPMNDDEAAGWQPSFAQAGEIAGPLELKWSTLNESSPAVARFDVGFAAAES
jgi:hypothetical protein